MQPKAQNPPPDPNYQRMLYYLGDRNRWVIVQSQDEEAALPPEWCRRLADSLPSEPKPQEPAKSETIPIAAKRKRGRPRKLWSLNAHGQ